MKIPRNDELDIIFSKRDSRGIRQPYDDPLSIMLRVKEFNIHQVLIDNEAQQISSTYLQSVDETGQGKDQAFHFSSSELH